MSDPPRNPPGPRPTRMMRAASGSRKLQPAQWRAGRTTQQAMTVLRRIIPSGRTMAWLPVIAIVFLVIVGFWTRHAVKESLRDIVREHLQAILRADLAALELWVDKEMDLVRSWARHPELRSATHELIGTVSADELTASPQAAAVLAEVVAPILHEPDYRGFMIIDRTGLVIAGGPAEFEAGVGSRVRPAGMADVARVLQGETIITRPYEATDLLITGEDPALSFAAPVLPYLISAAPIRYMGDVIAVLGVFIDPEKDFTRILSVARMGETGETYAFDSHGRMISESRFEDELREMGLLPAADAPGVSYTIQLRDPGGDMTRGFRPDVPAAALPFTRMYAAAIAGRNGIDLDGYRDYRGVEVIGAWHWSPKLELGVASEVDKREAFGAIRPLNIAFWSLLVLLAIAATMILASTWSLKLLARRIEEVQQLGQYTLVEKIGEGGMGTVYRARHAMLSRPTALKMLKPDALNDENVARFEREVQLTSQLTHPNTIEIYDYGRSPEGMFYYAMEYLRGVTLAQLIDLEGPIGSGRVRQILLRVCGSLEEAHQIGLVHRDIKPLNIMLCRQGARADVVKVLDFGLVKEVSTPAELQVTAPDIVGGTPPYIAPERLKDAKCLDPRSDLYSVGAVAFNLLTGQDAFTGSSAMEICYKVLHEDPPRITELVTTGVSAQLEDLVMRCLARDPDARPASAGAMIEILESIDDAGGWDRVEALRWWIDNEPRLVEHADYRPPPSRASQFTDGPSDA